MDFAGVLPEDAPDPRVETRKRLRDLPVPVMGLVPQPSLEDYGAIGIGEARDSAGCSQLSASISYTLWRNPDDRSDPVNLAELDARTRTAIEDVPPWPRPAWLVEQVERMRYPQLWEAVRTTWNRDASEHTTLSRQLVDHVNYILVNQFREQLGLGDQPWRTGATGHRITETAVNSAVTVTVDGVESRAAEIDTDPFVYAVGFEMAPGAVVTAVFPRDELPHLRIVFAQRRDGDTRRD